METAVATRPRERSTNHLWVPWALAFLIGLALVLDLNGLTLTGAQRLYVTAGEGNLVVLDAAGMPVTTLQPGRVRMNVGSNASSVNVDCVGVAGKVIGPGETSLSGSLQQGTCTISATFDQGDAEEWTIKVH